MESLHQHVSSHLLRLFKVSKASSFPQNKSIKDGYHLKKDFQKFVIVKGTLSNHNFIPTENSTKSTGFLQKCHVTVINHFMKLMTLVMFLLVRFRLDDQSDQSLGLMPYGIDACDGTAKASLQRHLKNKIITPAQFFSFAQTV